MTNYQKIKGMSIEEMATFLEQHIYGEVETDDDVRGCNDCIHNGTHHTNKEYLGTEFEHLYECKDCEYENDKTLITWLNKEAK